MIRISIVAALCSFAVGAIAQEPVSGPRLQGLSLFIDAPAGEYGLHRLRITAAENDADDIVVRTAHGKLAANAAPLARGVSDGAVASFDLPDSAESLVGCYVAVGKRRRAPVIRPGANDLRDYFISLRATTSVFDADAEAARAAGALEDAETLAIEREAERQAAEEALAGNGAHADGVCAAPPPADDGEGSDALRTRAERLVQAAIGRRLGCEEAGALAVVVGGASQMAGRSGPACNEDPDEVESVAAGLTVFDGVARLALNACGVDVERAFAGWFACTGFSLEGVSARYRADVDRLVEQSAETAGVSPSDYASCSSLLAGFNVAKAASEEAENALDAAREALEEARASMADARAKIVLGADTMCRDVDG